MFGVALPTLAAQRELTVIPGMDAYGHDYTTLKSVNLDDCKSACLQDERCQAFTFNVKVEWCFLKEGATERRPFDGAISGFIRAGGTPLPVADLKATRLAELRFLPPRERVEATVLETRIARMTPPTAKPRELISAARTAAGTSDHQRAADLYAAALRLDPANRSLWLELAQSALTAQSEDWEVKNRLKQDATSAAINAYVRSTDVTGRAAALALLGRAFGQREDWRTAIRASRAALALAESAETRAALDQMVAEHGFRVTDHKVDSDAASPRLCVEFSDPLPRDRANLADFVRVEDHADLPVEVEDRQICIDGVRHGERYGVQIRAGLPAADGEVLAESVDLDIYVRDRSPLVRFLGRAYVLPKGGAAALPVVSINTDLIDATVYRIGDRALTQALENGSFRAQLDEWDASRITDQTGETIWKGTVEVKPELNREVTTAVPVGALITDIKPGAYAMTAKAHNASGEDSTLATQWFIVTDLGLATFSGNDGLHTLVRSLSSAAPVGKVAVRLMAVNNEILGRATTDAQGYARFEPGLLRGTGGNAPALLVAEGPDGDYAFLDLTQTPFDLSDRGVTGRAPAKPLDVYLVSERGAYRPGEIVHLTALIRDATAAAVSNLPITLIIKRPDGVEQQRKLIPDQGAGGHQAAVTLSRSAMRGTWRAQVYTDPKAQPLADLAFLVEDFEPERLTFDLASQTPAIDPDNLPRIALDARFLYGAPAAGLAVEGEIQVKPTDALSAFPGYRFGLETEAVEPVSGSLPATTTDAQGQATVTPVIPEMAPTTKPLEASVQVQVIDDNGHPVERSVDLPVQSKQVRLGVKPLFDGSVEEGGNARFEIIAVGADGQRIALDGLRWTLSRLTTSFQWYASDGAWDYEPITSSQRVADGTVNTGVMDVGQIESPVNWGAYRLALESPDGSALPVDLEFEAGWYVKPAAVDTPDLLKVSLDKATYRVGETIKARIEPRFPGLALVMVVDDRVIDMKTVAVPEAGATVELPVTAKWGPGAYVTAVLYRPMDLAAKRMPARAIGLTWAGVDPGKRRLDLKFDLPPALTGTVRPRQTIKIPVAVGNLAAGQEAYVTVAAVDVGILNLTRYQPPAPDDWYFAQRRLGMEIRDFYGQLIDRMQGVPGVVRSGGDGSLLKLEGPPPSEQLVAYHSGIVRLDASGRASVSFDIPDFNGTLRIMAMSWTANGVGHAVTDLLVRDPVVVSAALPRFLAPGDRSRLLLNLAHVEGSAGSVDLRVSTAGGHARIPADAMTHRLTLTAGGRTQVTVPIEALGVGDDSLSIDLRTPDGQDLLKTLTVPVRSNAPPTSQSQVRALSPGETLHLDTSLLADRLPGTGSLLVSIGGAGQLDVAGLLLALDRYPYGCTEQLTSRALPLLYLNDVASAVGLSGDDSVKERVQSAITEILANQGSDGSFGLWGTGGGEDGWLDAYVTDFLTRAREQGYRVPEVAFDTALDNLRNRLSYAADFSEGGEPVAYALDVLARNGRAAIGDLRYYADTKLDDFATPMARAQLGAGLALYGDRPRADTVFRNALEMLKTGEDDGGWRVDFGSSLRDGAAVLTLATETGSPAVDQAALARRLQEQWSDTAHASTQDDAWLLLAAHALIAGSGQPQLTLNGETVTGGLYRRLDAATLKARPLTVANQGTAPLEALVTVTGVPLTPEPAGGSDYRIERAYYDLDGRRIQPSGVTQGKRMVAVITVTADSPRQARLIVNDPLPAGFEIDNPNLIKVGDIANINWLGLEDQAAHSEFRADRFIAAVDRKPDAPRQFQLAYRLRAVSPGVFVHPAATVEDMYRPQQRAWTETGTVAVREAQ